MQGRTISQLYSDYIQAKGDLEISEKFGEELDGNFKKTIEGASGFIDSAMSEEERELQNKILKAKLDWGKAKVLYTKARFELLQVLNKRVGIKYEVEFEGKKYLIAIQSVNGEIVVEEKE